MTELTEPSSPARSLNVAEPDAIASGQNVSRDDGTAGFRGSGWPGRVAGAALEAGAGALAHLAFDAYVGPCTVLHRERFPRTGATLVISNHPATWMDVVVLDGALGRPLHFLAQDTLYHPRPRAWLLDWFGSMRVAHSTSPHAPSARNADLLRRTNEQFARGAAIAVFPEGVSATDRSLGPLKTGAARVALAYRRCGRGALAVIPVGIHYVDRRSPRRGVVVDVGAALDLDPFADQAAADLERAVHELTEHMRRKLSRRIVDASAEEIALVIAGVETAIGPARSAREFTRLRALARRLHTLAYHEPERFRALRRASRILTRAGRALRVREALSEPAPRPLAERIAAWTLGVPVAAFGAVAHALPWAASEGIARRWANDPTRIGFARIGAGLVLFPLSYAGWAWVLGRSGTLDLPAIAAILVLLPYTGLALWWHATWLAASYDRWRIARLRRTHPALHARIAAARARLAGDTNHTNARGARTREV